MIMSTDSKSHGMRIDLLLHNRFAGDLNMVFMYGNAVKNNS